MTDSRRIPYSDGCPRCLRRNNPPTVQLRQGEQRSCLYHCRCGHEWTCNWSVDFVEGWDVLDERDAA